MSTSTVHPEGLAKLASFAREITLKKQRQDADVFLSIDVGDRIASAYLGPKNIALVFVHNVHAARNGAAETHFKTYEDFISRFFRNPHDVLSRPTIEFTLEQIADKEEVDLRQLHNYMEQAKANTKSRNYQVGICYVMPQNVEVG